MRDLCKIICGDALTELRKLPDESVQCCVTSPPYWGLRDYGTASWEGGNTKCDHRIPPNESDPKAVFDGSSGSHAIRFNRTNCHKCGAKRIDSQLGLEKTPEEYVSRMVEIFREVRRVLRNDGTLWLNLGDSYAGSMKGEGGTYELSAKQNSNRGSHYGKDNGEKNRFDHGLKPKDLCMIPARVAIALQADGWWLRDEIIWNKNNPMPESCTDRCTKSHEKIFMLTKAARYFYDQEAIKEPISQSYANDTRPHGVLRQRFYPESKYVKSGMLELDHSEFPNGQRETTRNKRNVWTVPTQPYPEAHFATYPPDLIKPCILAGTSAKGCCAKCGAPWKRVVAVEREPRGDNFGNRDGVFDHGQAGSKYQQITDSKTIGWKRTCMCQVGRHPRLNDPPIPCTVLDPFSGSGTTGEVAIELGRKAILIELNPKYVSLIEQRCTVTLGLAL
jgi:DNA modification methylase